MKRERGRETERIFDEFLDDIITYILFFEGEIHMIEGDVVIGNLTNSQTPINIPIMCHPDPANPLKNLTSDLSLEEFIKQVTADKKKGMKLDCKSIEAVTAVVDMLNGKNVSVHRSYCLPQCESITVYPCL